MASFVLALGLVTAAVPFILSERAGAETSSGQITFLRSYYKKTATVQGVATNILTSGIVNAQIIEIEFTTADNSYGVTMTNGTNGNALNGVNSGEVTATLVVNDSSYSSSSWIQSSPWSSQDAPANVEVTIVHNDGEVVYGSTTIRSDVNATADEIMPAITHVDAYYSAPASQSYTGIGVDFILRNVSNAESVELIVNRDGQDPYSITAKEKVINSINNSSEDTYKTGGPVVISGSRDSSSWNGQDGSWTGWDAPQSVTVVVTLKTGLELIFTDTTIGTTLADWDRVKPTDNEAPDVVLKVDDVAIGKDDIEAGKNPTIEVEAIDEQSGVDYIKYGVKNAEGQTVRGWYGIDNKTESVAKGITTLADGTYTLTARAWDRAGNKGFSNSVEFVVDRDAPEAPVLTGGAVRYMTPGNLAVTWDKSTSGDVSHYIYKNVLNGWTAPDVPHVAGQDSYTLNLETYVGSRIVEYRVAAVDFAGNTTWSAETFKVFVDQDKPTVVLNDLGSAPVRGSVTITGSVSDNFDLSHYNLSIYAGDVDLSSGNAMSSKREEATGWSKDNTTYTTVGGDVWQTLDTNDLDDGVYQIRLAAKDKAGLVEFKYFSFTVDNTPPDAPAVVVADANGVSGTADVDSTVAVTVNGEEVEVERDEEGNWFVVFDPAFAPGSSYSLSVVATDAAGNQSESTEETVDVPLSKTADGGREKSPSVSTRDGLRVATPLFQAGFIQNPDLTPETETQDAGEAALGATTENAAQAAGASEDASWLGLAWYWWVVIAGAIAAGAWWLFGAIRRRQGDAEA